MLLKVYTDCLNSGNRFFYFIAYNDYAPYIIFNEIQPECYIFLSCVLLGISCAYQPEKSAGPKSADLLLNVFVYNKKAVHRTAKVAEAGFLFFPLSVPFSSKNCMRFGFPGFIFCYFLSEFCPSFNKKSSLAPSSSLTFFKSDILSSFSLISILRALFSA